MEGGVQCLVFGNLQWTVYQHKLGTKRKETGVTVLLGNTCYTIWKPVYFPFKWYSIWNEHVFARMSIRADYVGCTHETFAYVCLCHHTLFKSWQPCTIVPLSFRQSGKISRTLTCLIFLCVNKYAERQVLLFVSEWSDRQTAILHLLLVLHPGAVWADPLLLQWETSSLLQRRHRPCESNLHCVNVLLLLTGHSAGRPLPCLSKQVTVMHTECMY